MPVLLFVIYPLSEIAAFILMGEAIGVLATLALIVASSVLGFVMLRDAGIVAASRSLRTGANPVASLAEGGPRIAAGLLLMVPGFLSDLAAFAILIPQVRAFLLGRLAGGAVGGRRQPSRPKTEVIEGDFRRLDR
jgi:UPF0716 protein FxsA